MKLAPQEVRTFFGTTVTWGRRPIFRAEPLANLLLDVLLHYRQEGKYQLHEFVIMPDHLHLLITPAVVVSLEKAVQLIKGGFSYRVKKELSSNLVIWQSGFTNHRIRGADDYVKHRMYIYENPVRARLAEAAEAYAYCSAAATIELDPPPPGLKPKLEAGSVSQG